MHLIGSLFKPAGAPGPPPRLLTVSLPPWPPRRGFEPNTWSAETLDPHALAALRAARRVSVVKSRLDRLGCLPWRLQ